LANMEKLKN